MDLILIVAVVAVLIGLFAAWKVFGNKTTKSKGNSILLLGLTGAGKTVIFSQLKSKSFRATQTSMKENDAEVELTFQGTTKKVHVVDVPGHQRLRSHLRDYIPIAGGLVFVVDSVDIENQLRLTAEYLFDLFTDKKINGNQLPILIACNKNDILTAKPAAVVKSLLEKEMDKLRFTRKSAPGQQEEEDIILGVEGKPFTFEQVDNPVKFVEVSGLEYSTVEPVVEFVFDTVK